MTLLNATIDFLYIVIQEAWYITAILAKYFLAGTVAYLAYEKEISWESFSESILENGKYFLFLTSGLGLVAASLGVELRPVAYFSSQLIALIYLAYLFWKY